MTLITIFGFYIFTRLTLKGLINSSWEWSPIRVTSVLLNPCSEVISQEYSSHMIAAIPQVSNIVMRFEVHFRCYRYLGRLLNLFNFIGIINYLWHMDDIYLVTRTPDRMLRHWRRMQMYITYMGMFWGKTLWLVVCVLCGLGSWASDPQRGCGASSGSWSGMRRDLYEIDWPGIPIMD